MTYPTDRERELANREALKALDRYFRAYARYLRTRSPQADDEMRETGNRYYALKGALPREDQDVLDQHYKMLDAQYERDLAKEQQEHARESVRDDERRRMAVLERAVADSKEEVATKTLNQVQRETAVKWAGRACAAAMQNKHDDAHEYAHESVEHAALSGDDVLLGDIRRMFAMYRVEA